MGKGRVKKSVKISIPFCPSPPKVWKKINFNFDGHALENNYSQSLELLFPYSCHCNWSVFESMVDY